MEFIIEDGYNTLYITILFMALFFNKSMIERYILLENDSTDFNGIYLQKIITNNFVKCLRNNSCITSQMLNEIRLCSMSLGWNNTKNLNAFNEYEPIEYLKFILKTINYVPLEIIVNAWNKNENKYFVSMDIEKNNYKNIKELYNDWAKKNKLINLPVFIVFKIDNLSNSFSINKNISLFSKGHQYGNVRWIFHSMFYDDGVIMMNENEIVTFGRNTYPHINKFTEDDLNKINGKILYIIYRKEPSI